jgi:hypothetical protein
MCFVIGWAWQESNLRPADYESDALTPELQAPIDLRIAKIHGILKIAKTIAFTYFAA